MTELVEVSADERSVLDVVFVHGLDGDARKSWSGKSNDSFWPAWLAQDVPGASVWSLDYDAASSAWLGRAMPIQDRAINLLAQLENHGIGQRPLCFVTHSMGGLVVKEMLLQAADARAGYAEFATATRGVVFLSTPHIGSDLVAKTVVRALGVVYRKTLAVDALERNSAHLRQLNDRYRDWAMQPDMQVEHRVFYETQPTRGVRVVDAGSANPGLPGHRPIPVDADHIDICKPAGRNNLVYGQVKRFIATLTQQGTGASIAGSKHRIVATADNVKSPPGALPDHSAAVQRDVSEIVATNTEPQVQQYNHVHQDLPVDHPPTEPVQAAVVFVHGLFSSSRTWEPFRHLIASDPDLAHVAVLDFEYPSPKFNLSPLRRIPDFDVLADSLRTYLDTEATGYTDVVLASHSQGGLIVQRYLARMVMGARGRELQRIRRVVMFACPNSGSEIFLLGRRRAWLWRHPQERELRPINEAVSAAQQVVINRVVHAQRVASDECPVSVHAYAGDRDNVVTPTSAKGVFPDTGVLPGDHFSIIQTDSTRHRAFLALKGHLTSAFRMSELDLSGEPATLLNGADIGVRDSISSKSAVPDAANYPNDSIVIAKWNQASRTVDFMLTPQTALEWIKELGKEGPPDG